MQYQLFNTTIDEFFCITVAVTATSKIPSAYAFSIRGGPNSTAGLVAVRYNNGRTGMVCTEFWSTDSADVVCRQLGYVNSYTNFRKS